LIQLDDKTLQALSSLIVEGTIYRTGQELLVFFRDAGVNPPDFQGGRRAWTLERLREYNDDPQKMDQVIMRLANPREYVGNPQALHATIGKLNDILAIDGLRVTLDGMNSKIETVTSHVPQMPVAKANKPASPDFSQITSDPVLMLILNGRWEEAVRNVECGSYLSAVIMQGSILEGVLLAVAQARPREANQSKCSPKDKATGAVKKFGEWTLEDLINVAHDAGWIQRDVRDFSHVLQDYRNLVHPHKQAQTGDWPDDGTARISLQVTQEVINDVIDYLT
jgi:hypothetical protein